MFIQDFIICVSALRRLNLSDWMILRDGHVSFYSKYTWICTSTGKKTLVLFCFWLLLIGPRNIEALKTFVLEEAEKAAAKAQLGEDKDL